MQSWKGPSAGHPVKSKWESQKEAKHPKNLWNPTQTIPQLGTKVLQLVSKFKNLNFKRVQTIPGHVEKLKMRSFLFHRNPWIGQRP